VYRKLYLISTYNGIHIGFEFGRNIFYRIHRIPASS
jgi:hypothetical protein